MTTNEITGDTLRSKATSERYRENFDDIFRPLCTKCGKLICEHKEAEKSASSLMEVENVPNSE